MPNKKHAMIEAGAGILFAGKLATLIEAAHSPPQPLLELMLGYAAGNLMGRGASKDDVRQILESVLEMMPDAPTPAERPD